ncbi:monovalent cation:proton antiporter-2 (CPA2) family protein [Paraglaciecola aquimarina]|uniref:Monovalent cation:proton antiporter-2 (CPA2) family protein n=1 Tax=Paraglaciecola algarum TaxID=3050085 RepID=A0ABS9D530_9ALTE|nr:monovalent cation:proton antiporter-2 (CPA2) family protein [Paraglaciecola sp. G1-23]MCF2948020.1 monovalent cation:proton antiporter-2 (CPA2) family protein [Paraglaciecola sp. G1-23]
MSLLASGMVFLAATVVAIPIFKKLKLGAILGYLVAGVIIGPAVMNWVNHPDIILHFAELGVVFLLFVIGLELEPEKLWKMRQQILLSGGGQLLTSAVIITTIMHLILSYSLITSVVVGLALALSSTAFALQLMAEYKVLKAPPGKQGFAMLLMQDLAVIPILLLVEGLSTNTDNTSPAWWVSVGVIGLVLIIGRYFINPFLRLISNYGSTEVMTSAALLIVMATALGMQEAGLSMGMGAFIAGILLANSSFRHQLETEIEPFKGLLLGLFFIAIGMNLDLGLLVSEPIFILSSALLLVVVKTGVIYSILKLAKQSKTDAIRIGLMLSQGGEFAFVVMTQAAGNGVLEPHLANQVTLIVGISMALTSPLVILHSIWFNSKNCPPVYDTNSDLDEPQVIIAGFGRFGQISARILAANNIPFTALDKDAQHIEFLKQFGSKVFYGDASRLDLLKTAGIEHARVILIAIDNDQEAIKLAKIVKNEYPKIKIIARARNRFIATEYSRLGIKNVVRELFAGGLESAELLLKEYGYQDDEAKNMVHIFARHDKQLLEKTYTEKMDLQQVIDVTKQGREELQSLFTKDKQVTKGKQDIQN